MNATSKQAARADPHIFENTDHLLSIHVICVWSKCTHFGQKLATSDRVKFKIWQFEPFSSICSTPPHSSFPFDATQNLTTLTTIQCTGQMTMRKAANQKSSVQLINKSGTTICEQRDFRPVNTSLERDKFLVPMNQSSRGHPLRSTRNQR